MLLSIERTPQNLDFFAEIRTIADAHGKLITEMRLTKDAILFKPKNGDVFAICEFLDPDQSFKYMSLIDTAGTISSTNDLQN